MRVLVTGGTGTLGSKFAGVARNAGHTVRILSRRPPPDDEQSSSTEWAQADLSTGKGVGEAVSGADAVLHAATKPGFGTQKVDVGGTRRLVDASEAAGVDHFIYPSIVGVDQIPFGYYQHKVEGERLVEEGRVPHTILRATQFHSFVEAAISAAMRLPLATFLPTDFQMQSVAASEVAKRLHKRLEEGPGGRLPDFGGPEVKRLGALAREWMRSKQKRKRLFRLPLPGQTARAFRDGKNTAPARKEGTITWSSWLDGSSKEQSAVTMP